MKVMLKSFEVARNQLGRVMKAMARECEVSESTFYKWSCGIRRAPKHKRQSIDRALGANVNWSDYDAECAEFAKTAELRAKTPVKAPKGSKWGEVPPEPAKAPPSPPVAARDAATELWGDV